MASYFSSDFDIEEILVLSKGPTSTFIPSSISKILLILKSSPTVAILSSSEVLTTISKRSEP